MKKLNYLSKKASIGLLLILPPIFFFSYYPIITLGNNDYMNFELSLPEIWLVLFSLCQVPRIKTLYNYYGPKKLLFASIFPLYLSLSILWSENRPRAILTAGLLWLLIFATLNIIIFLKSDKTKKLQSSLIRILLVSAVAVSAFCWLQCILDVVGVSREATLLCRGCVSSTFGFPHPSGFAIEPQFMGNLLLAPTLLSFYLLIKKRGSTLLTLFLSTTLFLTLSRGAIYAFIFAFILMLILIRKKTMLFRPIAYAFISLVLALVSFGFLANFSSTSDDFITGTTKAIHQLSLGKIDLRPERVKDEVVSSESSQPADTDDAKEGSSSFSGYVEESTNTRLGLNSLAIRTWTSSPKYLLIGAGLGSAGPAMHNAFPDEIGPKEIVQNEYVSLLLETGLLGVAIIMTVVIFTTVYLVKRKIFANNPLFISIVFAFALTLLFFSGLPNALHIYLFPLLLFNFNLGSKDDFLVADKVKRHRNSRH